MTSNRDLPIHHLIGNANPHYGEPGTGDPVKPIKGEELNKIINDPETKFIDGPTCTQLDALPKRGDWRLSNDKKYHVGEYDRYTKTIYYHQHTNKRDTE